MKPSRYNYSAQLKDGSMLFFNFYTLNLLVLEESEAHMCEDILANPDHIASCEQGTELKALLAEKGFLIDNEIDERELLRSFRYGAKNQHKSISLTVAPSLACNFRCVYCYEDGDNRRMTPEIEAALVKFLSERVVEDGSLNVTWFGGEPLLQLDIIARLSEAFIGICEERNAGYVADIITNGYLLTPDNVKTLEELQVRRAQITLDGPPRFHDARRCAKNGGTTFHRILENTKHAADRMNVCVRMNIDETNRLAIPEMLDLLVREGLETKMGFYLGQTFPYTSACADVASYCMHDEDFSLLGLETQLDMVRRGFTSSFGMPASRDIFCLAEGENTFVITPSGGIVKCWNEIDNPAKETGHLCAPESPVMRANQERWRRKDPFALECGDCGLLPICMGGCPYICEQKGNVDCHDWKHNLKESLAFYYYVRRARQEAELLTHFEDTVDAVKQLKDAVQQGVTTD